MSMGSGTLRHGTVILLISLISLVIYQSAFEASFHFDDFINIVNNSRLHIQDLSWETIRPVIGMQRPVANLSFALNHYWAGDTVSSYHLVNFLIHLITAWGLYGLVLATISLMDSGRRFPYDPVRLAALAALLWATHPIQTQTVVYIVQRMTGLSAMFYVLALLCYARARLSWGYRPTLLYGVGTVLCGVLAMGSKENSVTLPLMLLLYEFYFVPRERRRDPRIYWIVFSSAFLIGVAWISSYHLGENQGPISGIGALVTKDYAREGISAAQRLLTEFRVVMYYILLLVLPLPALMNIDHDFPVSPSPWSPPETLGAILVIGGLIGYAIRIRKSRPVISFCLLWFFINLALESSIVKIDLAFEHRLYLPSMAYALLAALLVESIFVWASARFPKRGRAAVISLTVALILVQGGATHLRNGDWQNGIRLWSDAVAKSPEKARAHYGLGFAYEQSGITDEALWHYRESLILDPRNALGHQAVARNYLRVGHPEWALGEIQRALSLQPDQVDLRIDLAAIYIRLGQIDRAEETYRVALAKKPDDARIHYSLAVIDAGRGRRDQAKERYLEAIRLDPGLYRAYNNLALIYQAEGKPREAVAAFEEALRINPQDSVTLQNLGGLYLATGRLEDGVGLLRKAAGLNPEVIESFLDLAARLEARGEAGRAEEVNRLVMEILPEEPGYDAIRDRILGKIGALSSSGGDR